MEDAFRAYLVDADGDRRPDGPALLPARELPAGEVTVRVEYSSVNFKDALASHPDGGVATVPRLVPGIDLAGTVSHSIDPEIPVGAEVLAHGYDIGVGRHGGFAEFARLPSSYVVPLPEGLGVRDAMTIGTAGFTAALSLATLEERGLAPAAGPVLVTGASGGVGSTAVALLADRGYEVIASTGKRAREWLLELGASEVVPRPDVSDSPGALGPERWAAVIDPVGGRSLAGALSELRAGGAVAQSGMVGGIGVKTTVLPFIIRGAAVLGIDSVNVPIAHRRELWERIATELRPPRLDCLVEREIGLDGLAEALGRISNGEARGRTLIRLD